MEPLCIFLPGRCTLAIYDANRGAVRICRAGNTIFTTCLFGQERKSLKGEIQKQWSSAADMSMIDHICDMRSKTV